MEEGEEIQPAYEHTNIETYKKKHRQLSRQMSNNFPVTKCYLYDLRVLMCLMKNFFVFLIPNFFYKDAKMF